MEWYDGWSGIKDRAVRRIGWSGDIKNGMKDGVVGEMIVYWYQGWNGIKDSE